MWTELAANNSDEAINKAAMGGVLPENAPRGMLHSTVYVGAYNRAEARGDVMLMKNLSTRSKLHQTFTGFGQEIQYLNKLSKESFGGMVKQIAEARVKAIEKFIAKGKFKVNNTNVRSIAEAEKVAEKGLREASRSVPVSKRSLSDFINEIKC
jgi:hypothetical protein